MKGFRGYIISQKPLLLYTGDGADISCIQNKIINEKAIFLITMWWTAEPLSRILRIVKNHYQKKKNFPLHQFIYLCNTVKEVNRLRAFGLDARFCHQNATVDENIFKIFDREKKFDAIYDAQIAEFKRYFLATELNSLAIISYIERKNKKLKSTYNLRESISHAHWINDPFNDDIQKSFLSPSDVAYEYNRAHVGLCLSKVEGAMFASIQYLLCGLPVLNVPNIGGRDFFLHDDVSITVEATPKKVREGVSYLIESNILPIEVRTNTLNRINVQRSVLADIINESLHELDTGFVFNWQSDFKNKMLDFITYDHAIKLLN